MDRPESPTINLHVYQPIFDKIPMTVQWKKTRFLNRWHWDSWVPVCKSSVQRLFTVVQVLFEVIKVL